MADGVVRIGMNLYRSSDLSLLEPDLDELKAANFKTIRATLGNLEGPVQVLEINKRGLNAIWGLTFSGVLTAAEWLDYRDEVLIAAQWAQDNDVYEFQLGNELENKVDGTTLTEAQLLLNLKSLATEVQAIFTRGNISYSTYGSYLTSWSVAGKGDIDIISSNVYKSGNDWITEISSMIAAFGITGYSISEFNSASLDENIVKSDVQIMIDYIENSNISTACFYNARDEQFGYKNLSGRYNKVWEVLKEVNDLKRRKTSAQKEIRGLSHG